MRILFVHQNFPAQFVHLAPALATRGHDVSALTVDTNQRPTPVPRSTYAYAPQRIARSPLTLGFAASADRGAVVARAAERLRREEGLAPDVIFGHVGWGESLYLKEVWPDARLIAYAEFYWRSRGLYYEFDEAIYPRDFQQALSAATTTASLTALLAIADGAVSPTSWQARSFPPAFKNLIRVIHDGIDTATARPNPDATVSLPKRNLTFHPGDEVRDVRQPHARAAPRLSRLHARATARAESPAQGAHRHRRRHRPR